MAVEPDIVARICVQSRGLDNSNVRAGHGVGSRPEYNGG